MDSPPPSAADAAAAAAAPATGSTATAQVVGNAFVHQYYNILHQSPDHVYRFYQQASRIGRPAGDEMDTVTTMKAISDKIMSMDIVRAEIKAVDAQESLSGGVTVLVTGHLTRSDGLRREFAQSFFLAPQHRGYYVLNDILRYVGVEEQLVDSVSEPEPEPEPEQLPPPQQSTPEVDVVAAPAANGTIVAAVESVPREHEALPPSQQHVTEPAPHPQEADQNEEEIYNPPNEAEGVAAEETQAPQVIDEVPNNVAVIMPSLSAPVLQEEAPKKSYASIVKVMKEVPPSTSAIPSRPPPPKPEKQIAPAPAAPVADAATLSPNPESSNVQEAEVDAHAIYVRSLPLSATPEQLEEVFKKFGTIKPDGIQVRSHKIQGFCYGFVEFEDPSAVQSAIAGSPVMIGDRSCYVEEKRTAGSRGGGRGRFPPGRGGNFRVEGMRGRGNYTGGRNYGRGEFSYRSDYGGRGSGRGGSSRGGDVGYQRVDHSGATAVRSARVPSGTNAVAK